MLTLMEVSKRQFVSGAIWKALEQFGSKAITMIVSIILARLLSPDDYGLLALTAVFTSLADVLIDGGMSTALIRKREVSDGDYSAVFAISSITAIILYAVLFVAAPYVANYYDSPILASVIRVMGLVFFIQAFTVVRNGIINRNMQFKLLFRCNMISSIVSGVLGIVCAFVGIGVWALVVQRLFQQAILTVLLLCRIQWKIKWRFDLSRIREMLGFSIGVLGTSLLSYIGNNLYNVVIGKRLSVADVGYYEKGYQLPMQFSLYTFGAMSSVLLPTLSKSQDDMARFKRITRKVAGMTAFLVFPLMIIMLLCSKELICLLFTEKWLPSLRTMQIMALYYVTVPFLLLNTQVLYSLGRSGIRAKIEALRVSLTVFFVIAISLIVDANLEMFVISNLVVALAVLVASYLPVKKLLDYSIVEVIEDIGLPALFSIVLGVAAWLVGSALPAGGNLVLLCIKTSVGVFCYIVLSVLFRLPYIKELRGAFSRKRNE